MIWFPQIGAGSATQYPLRRTRRWRSIQNSLEGGERIRLADGGARSIEWEMNWKDLSDGEVQSLTDLFALVKGSFGSFAFTDPLANLTGWSEDLTRPDWDLGLMTASPGAGDPTGTQRAWTIANPSAGEQRLAQSFDLPGSYVVCFSVWVRSDAPATVSLERDGVSAAVTVGSNWRRAYVSGPGNGNSTTCALAIPAGVSIQAFGFQAEVQPYPSQYKVTGAPRGIYSETRFATDELTVKATAPGLSSCDIVLVSRI